LFADEELGALCGVAGNSAARLGAVGQAGRVAQKDELRLRKPLDERAQHGEAAETGIEYADGVGHGSYTAGLVMRAKSARVLDIQHKSMKTLLSYGLRVPFL